MIDRLADAGFPVDNCCRILGVSRQGYYRYKRRPTSATQLRRQWLTGLIREVHVASRGTYGYRRIHAELTMAMGIKCSSRLISVLMTQAGIYGLPGPARVKRLRGVVTADDLVNRKFHRLHPNELWVTDITEHPTREGKVFCAAVLDAFSRRIIGWSIDSRQDSTLVVNALDMAIRNRRPEPGGIVHADHGTQFTDADRALEPQEMEDSPRARERDLRLHRDIPQPATTTLIARLSHPNRIRTILGEELHPRLKLTTESGNQTVGQVNCSAGSDGTGLEGCCYA